MFGYVALGCAYIVADAIDSALRFGIKPLLMPTLALWVFMSRRNVARSLYVGLLFAMLGDTFLMLPGGRWFIVGMISFLLMQFTYVWGFARLGAFSALARRRWIPLLYGIVWLVANVGLGPKLGALQIPVAVYSAALCLMAAASAGVSLRAGLGGLTFAVSDALIGAGKAGLDFPGRSTAVMITYLVAQFLIVSAWVSRSEET